MGCGRPGGRGRCAAVAVVTRASMARRLARLEGGGGDGRCPSCGWPPAPGEPIRYVVTWPEPPTGYDPTDWLDEDEDAGGATLPAPPVPTSGAPEPEPEDEGPDVCEACGRSLVYVVRFPDAPDEDREAQARAEAEELAATAAELAATEDEPDA